jgi:hypothetical protein
MNVTGSFGPKIARLDFNKYFRFGATSAAQPPAGATSMVASALPFPLRIAPLFIECRLAKI